MNSLTDYFKTKQMRTKAIEKLDTQIFEKEKDLREVKSRVDQATLELKQKNAEFEFDMKRKNQDFTLLMEGEKARVAKQVEIKIEEMSKAKNESQAKLLDVEAKSKTARETDAITLKLDFDKQINTLKAEHQMELAKLREELSADYAKKSADLLKDNYDKLKTALETLHTDGNAQTKFVQDLAKSMLTTKLEHRNLQITNTTAPINS